MNPSFLQTHKDGVTLTVRVTPKSTRSKITGVAGTDLKISLHAPPADGKANKELVRLLSKILSIPKTGIEILSGQNSRSKRLLLIDQSLESIAEKLDRPKSK